MLGQLQDAGNTVTIAEYLNLLSLAGMLSGLQKFDERKASSRKSSPRLMAHDSSLQGAMLDLPKKFVEMDRSRWGHLVETAVGAYLINRGKEEGFEVFWWREGSDEVDFVLRKGEQLTAIEVKSGAIRSLKGMEKFLLLYPRAHRIVVGSPETMLGDFLAGEVELFLL